MTQRPFYIIFPCEKCLEAHVTHNRIKVVAAVPECHPGGNNQVASVVDRVEQEHALEGS